MRVAVAPALAGVVRLGIVACGGASNARHDTRLDAPLAQAEEAARRAPPDERQAVRAMYRRLGIDPTKTRPSSEALLRRVKKGDHLPRINTLVDICNWCSLECQLPYGLYDLSRIEPPIELRLGADGEQYEGIRKDAVHVSGRPTLADQRGFQMIGHFGLDETGYMCNGPHSYFDQYHRGLPCTMDHWVHSKYGTCG